MKHTICLLCYNQVMETSSMERAQFRLQQLAAHLHPEQGSLSFMACMGGARRDSRVHYARAALNDARFMRPGQDSSAEEAKHSAQPSSGGSQDKEKKADSAHLASPPLFSKPSVQDVIQPVSEPLFSRSSKLSPQEVEKEKEAAALAWAAAEEQPTHPETESIGKGYEWFPRMDVMESGSAFVVTVELPGVNADGICCEVTPDSLVVSGSRSTDWWKNNGESDKHPNGNGNGNGNGNANGNGSVYHRRELARGPYRAVWRLPKNADLGGISAEFIDGFLRVLVPKKRMVRYL
ncbi:hypothetical protein M758_5G141100 [Ceratodon purpureus]|uniref:SHSP domain-containing protein n=1 Tax=Ceratodon purpureus TaxID=3225 RepID=A0A8T0I2Y6_CERPU|nr:hypothetical protein KC19_5G147500 [Ceratodon purpureus]KAG0616774.1 hypothetical protein M758_5G141100 [Ceratodon purpureus]